MTGHELSLLVGRNIRRARRAKGLDQAALASALNIHNSTISRWESGQTSIFAVHMAALAERLGRDPAWFYQPNPGRTATTSVVRDILDEFDALDCRKQRACSSYELAMVIREALDKEHVR